MIVCISKTGVSAFLDYGVIYSRIQDNFSSHRFAGTSTGTGRYIHGGNFRAAFFWKDRRTDVSSSLTSAFTLNSVEASTSLKRAVTTLFSTGQKADITVTIRRGTTTMYSQTVSDVSKGSYELDLSSYLLVGNTDIYVVATTTDPTTGKKQTRQAFTSVKVVSLSLTSSYNLAGAIAAGGYTLADTINIPAAESFSTSPAVVSCKSIPLSVTSI